MADGTHIEWTGVRHIKSTEAKIAYDRARNIRIQAKKVAARPPDPIEALTSEECAYIAGLIDGEGTIFVMKHKDKTFYACVSICMTHEGVLTWLASALGLKTSRVARKKANWRDQVGVRIHGKRAMRLCERMLPYLRVKKRQAQLILAFPAEERHAPGVLLSSDVNSARIRLREEINGLNSRGAAP